MCLCKFSQSCDVTVKSCHLLICEDSMTYNVKVSVIEKYLDSPIALTLPVVPLATTLLDGNPFQLLPGMGPSHGGGVVHVSDALLRPAVHHASATTTTAGAAEVAGDVAVDGLGQLVGCCIRTRAASCLVCLVFKGGGELGHVANTAWFSLQNSSSKWAPQ